MEVREKIIGCIALVLQLEIENIRKISGDQPLQLIGMDSLNSVDIIIGIEREVGICFDDEELVMKNINTINKLVNIVTSKLTA